MEYAGVPIYAGVPSLDGTVLQQCNVLSRPMPPPPCYRSVLIVMRVQCFLSSGFSIKLVNKAKERQNTAPYVLFLWHASDFPAACVALLFGALKVHHGTVRLP